MTRVHDVDMERHAPTGAGEDRAITVDSALELHPKVALRPEPFGALAYHYGNRRLVFLRHPDVVAVVKTLADHRTLGEALRWRKGQRTSQHASGGQSQLWAC